MRDYLMTSLWRAHRDARKHKLKTLDEHKFELEAAKNIYQLCEEIINRSYHPSPGIAFIVSDPKFREVVAALYRDRVVHHLIFDVCNPWIERHLIHDSYSCRKGKGTLMGQQRLQHFARRIEQTTGETAYAIKLDIHHYFVSINRRKVYNRAIWALDQQFHHCDRPDAENGILCKLEHREQLFRILKFLWAMTIFDDPLKNCRIRGKITDWEYLAPGKSQADQPPGIGIVIGNLTSQLLSNLFLDQLDHFVTNELGLKEYGRYVDDFYFILPKSRLPEVPHYITLIEDFLDTELELTLHKTKRLIKPVKDGIPFLGANVFLGHIDLGRRAKRRAYEAAEAVITGQKDVDNFAAQMGTTCHLNQRHFYKDLFDKYGWYYAWTPDGEKIFPGGPRDKARKAKTL